MKKFIFKKLILKKLIFFGVLFLGAMAAYSQTQTQTQNRDEQSLDQIAAVVNKTIITQSELDQAINRIKQQLSASQTPIPPSDILRRQVLDQLINRKLQLDMAEEMGIRVTEKQVTDAINKVAQKNKMPLSALYAAVAEQGTSKSEYQQEIREEIQMNQIQQQVVGNKITISPQEVDDFMRSAAWQSYNNKSYHIENILIPLPEKPSLSDINNTKMRAEALVEKLHHGMSFREAAVAESSNNNALQGGDLGWRKLPEIPSAFASQLVHMKTGDIAGPISTPNGFHIIHVVGIKQMAMEGTQAQQRQQIQELLYQRKFEEALQAWMMKLRSAAFINLHPDRIKSRTSTGNKK